MTQFFSRAAIAPGLVALICAASAVLVSPTVLAQAVDEPTTGEQHTGDDSDSDREDDGDASVEEQLVFALSAYHSFPTRAELDDIADPNTMTELLRSFATSPERRPSMRTRAVDALGFYEDAETRAFLEELVARPRASGASERVADLMRHHAVTSLARAHGDDALETLAPLLEHDDVQLRMTAVVALAKHGSQRAHRRLAELRAQTDDDLIRRHIDKYVPEEVIKSP